jgi:hypothetical protein
VSLSLGEFAAHLMAAEADLKVGMEVACVRACKMVAREAKDVIGTYRYGWPQLAESTQEERVRLGYSANDPLLRDGTLRDSIGVDAPHWEDPHKVDGYVGSPLKVALWQEVGTSNIPPRSFLAGAARRSEDKIHDMAGRVVQRTLLGGPNFREWRHALELAKQGYEKLIELGETEE